MAVVCESESFTVAGTPYQRQLGTLGRKGLGREINKAVVLDLGRKA